MCALVACAWLHGSKPLVLETDWYRDYTRAKFKKNKEILPSAHEWICLEVYLWVLVIH